MVLECLPGGFLAGWTENSEIYFIRNTKLMFDLGIKGLELVPSSCEIRRFINKEDLKLGRWGCAPHGRFVASVDFSMDPVVEFASVHLKLNSQLSLRLLGNNL